MNIFFPRNFYTQLIFNSLPDNLKEAVHFVPSSSITPEMIRTPDSAALIPVMDLLKNKDLFISASFGISFEGALNMSYIYFNEPGRLKGPAMKNDFKEICLAGDVSSNEVIISKILFDELYDSQVSINLLTQESSSSGKDVIITGDKNFAEELIFSGISFSEEVIEMLSLPYVCFVMASGNETILKSLNADLKNASGRIYDEVENKFNLNFSPGIKEYIRQNISSLIIDFDNNDLDAIDQILQLPYLHGMIENIVDLKFV
jgi:hypothetical protein